MIGCETNHSTTPKFREVPGRQQKKRTGIGASARRMPGGKAQQIQAAKIPMSGGLTLGVLVEGHICVTRGSAGNTE
jgi:hypothetical protein